MTSGVFPSGASAVAMRDAAIDGRAVVDGAQAPLPDDVNSTGRWYGVAGMGSRPVGLKEFEPTGP